MGNPEVISEYNNEGHEESVILEINSLDLTKKLLVIRYEGVLAAYSQWCSPCARPRLDEFLYHVGVHYNIAIWSALNRKKLAEEMNTLGILNNPNYSIVFCLDGGNLVSTPEPRSAKLPPMTLIWEKYPAFSLKNTVVVDREESPVNIPPFLRVKKFNRIEDDDRQLIALKAYLESITSEDDFSVLNHIKWPFFRLVSGVSAAVQDVAPMISGKKLAVFNLDEIMYTPEYSDAARAFLHELFTSIYQKYNIAIWSERHVRFTRERATFFGLDNHPNFNICFYLNYSKAEIFEEKRSEVLDFVWKTYPQYRRENTILVDNMRFNMLAIVRGHPEKPASFAIFIAFLYLIAERCDFTRFNLDKWHVYIPPDYGETPATSDRK